MPVLAHYPEIIGKKRHLGGWKPDRPDYRDLPYRAARRFARIPGVADLRSICSRVEDQGDIGSCTANSSSSAFEMLFIKAGVAQPELSRLFLYYATRVWVEGVAPADDAGAFIRDVMKTLAKYGICAETDWAYDPKLYSKEPSKAAQKKALNHQITTYSSIPDLRALRTCLAEGYPVVGGFTVPENAMSDKAAKTGVIRFPSKSEPNVGGHAVLFVGYDDKKRLITFQNSWSVNWGSKGFGFLPYKFVEEGLADDFWTIRAGEL